MSDLSTDPLPSEASVRLSLPEIEALCVKAARGAGMAWGLAEEAGFAARWLAAAGLPGPELLLRQLRAAGTADGRPEISKDAWRAYPDRALCPITVGATLSDRAGPVDGPIQIAGLANPALLMPFLGMVASTSGKAICLSCDLGQITVNRSGPDDTASVGKLSACEQADVEIAFVVATTGQGKCQPGRVVTRAVWQGLDALALKTTVPATAQSRADAGAGTSDND